MPVNDDLAAEILAKCARHCCICRKYRPLHLQIHHLIEESAGGNSDFDNLIPICTYCHSDVHTETKLTRRFTVKELKKHRTAVYELVSNGKLPTSESNISSTDLDYIVNRILEKLQAKDEKAVEKYSEKSLKILVGALSDESEICYYEIKTVGEVSIDTKSRFYSIETGERRFISETDIQELYPPEITQLINNGLIKKIEQNKYKVTLKGIKLYEEMFGVSDKFTMVKCKCHNCSLHFMILTWYPEKHRRELITCPECKKSNGRFSIWSQQEIGNIFEHVPGNTK